jgi:hypothetical protein
LDDTSPKEQGAPAFGTAKGSRRIPDATAFEDESFEPESAAWTKASMKTKPMAEREQTERRRRAASAEAGLRALPGTRPWIRRFGAAGDAGAAGAGTVPRAPWPPPGHSLPMLRRP